MNLQECKDKVAQRMGFSNWKRFEQFVKPTSAIVEEVATLYAIEKIKEALKVAAERATLAIERNNKRIFKGNYAFFAENMEHIEVDKQSILSLETELIENIKNEI